MNRFCLVLLSALAVTIGAAVDKRQIPTCTNAFTLTNNPCFAGNLVYYYPVPGDNTKFVQCDSSGDAYVVQCPAGRVYDAVTTTCRASTVVNPPVATALPSGPAAQCTARVIATGQLFFAVPRDNTRYYRCNGINQISVMSCGSNLVWDQTRSSCVLNFGTTATKPTVTTTIQNPCTQQQLNAKHYYFTHPDPTKFIQCDLTGQFYVLSCPSGLSWSQFYQVCANPAQNTIIG